MNHLSRKDFLKTSAAALGGFALTSMAPAPTVKEQKDVNANATKALFKNVRLETGFIYEEGEVVATKTDLFTVEVENGHISKITQGGNPSGALDAQGLLMLPSFKDMHIHLDKTLYGTPWHRVRPKTGGIKGMIALEQQILPGLLKDSTAKAEKMIELLQSKGSGFARSHVNIEPTSGLKSLEHLLIALENKKDSFGAELVAFPQHGVFYTETAPLLREAAQMPVDFIGGLDPTNVDGSIEKTMDFTVQLTLDYNKGIDIHLHETGASGIKTIEYLIAKVVENPVLKGKTFVSHAFALARVSEAEQRSLAERLAAAEIGINSTIPFGSLMMPIPVLLKNGVRVMTGNDSIVDHWSVFGTGSVLEKASLMAQLYGYNTEEALSRSLKLATAGVLPLDDEGTQQWPKPGDPADFVLVEASCSAEAVARVSPVRSLVHRGNVVFG